MTESVTLLENRIRDRSDALRDVLTHWKPKAVGSWDSRDGWDNRGGGFDNKPTWDNWSKR